MQFRRTYDVLLCNVIFVKKVVGTAVKPFEKLINSAGVLTISAITAVTGNNELVAVK